MKELKAFRSKTPVLVKNLLHQCIVKCRKTYTRHEKGYYNRLMKKKCRVLRVKMLKFAKKLLHGYSIKSKTYHKLAKEDYYKLFGIVKLEKENYYVPEENKVKVKAAYDKAWETRNFEIDKFWTRAAYFWGFIVLIFGGYISVRTSSKNMVEPHLDLFLLCLGLLFSLAWWLVIRGSKCWQENWERHIDMLENFITGPIYKTIYYGNKAFFSVSKLNEIMAIAVLLVWIALFFQNLHAQYSFEGENIDWIATLAVFGTAVLAFMMLLGYCRGHYYTAREGFFDRNEY